MNPMKSHLFLCYLGSIETSFIMNGTEDAVNTAIYNLWQALQDGMTIIYDGQTVDAMPYMSVDGRDKKNVEEVSILLPYKQSYPLFFRKF